MWTGKQQRDRRQRKDVTIVSKTIDTECSSIWATLTPPPTAASDSRLLHHGPARLMPLSSQVQLAKSL